MLRLLSICALLIVSAGAGPVFAGEAGDDGTVPGNALSARFIRSGDSLFFRHAEGFFRGGRTDGGGGQTDGFSFLPDGHGGDHDGIDGDHHWDGGGNDHHGNGDNGHEWDCDGEDGDLVDGEDGNDETNGEPVPEPATLAMMGTGLFGLLGFEIRRRKAGK